MKRRAFVVVLCVATLAACGDDAATSTTAPVTDAGTTSLTTVAAAASTAPETTTTTAAPTTSAPTTSAATTSAATTAAATTTVAPATTLPSGPATATCVGGWVTPEPGTELRTFPLDMMRGHLGLDADDLFIVNEMRYFVGPEDVEMVSPRRAVERWYVDAVQQDDPAIAGRWIVRRIDIGAGVAYEADAGTTGFDTGTWWAPDAGGYDPFTPACTADNGPFCLCDWGVEGCSCADPAMPACTGPPPEVMGCLEDL